MLLADPLDPAVAGEPMVLGPVISAKSREFILQMIQTGVPAWPAVTETRTGGKYDGPTRLRTSNQGANLLH